MTAVLIIDDDTDIRELWASFLEDGGYEISLAASGADGLRIIDERPIDIVVTDVLMPDKDGIETLLEIKQRQPRAKVLVVSGGGISSNTAMLDVADAMGADGVLQKPVEMDKFCSTIAGLARAA